MIKISFIAIFTIFLLVLSTLSAKQYEAVKANPISVSVPDNPDTNQPIITVNNPKNDINLNITCFTLTFTVKKPSSWFSFYPVHGDLISISYLLDGEKTDVASSDLDTDHYSSKPLTFTETISELSEGNHSLQVYVRSVSYYLDPNRPAENSTYGWWMYPPANNFMDTYSNINFTVNTIHNSPTVPSTPTIPEFSVPLDITFLVLVAVALAVLVKRKNKLSGSFD